MDLAVKLFGPEAEAAGQRVVHLKLEEGATCAEVLRALGEAAPALQSSLSALRLAINHEFAEPGAPVAVGDELALIGLVSGG